MSITNRVLIILKKLSGLDDILIEDNLQNDLGLDSITMVTLLLEIEEEFRITLDESDMNPFDLTTVADVVVLVEKYVGE